MSDDASKDVNDRVSAEWKADTTPFERVRTVMKRTYSPESADEIAERALTTPTTARKHLEQLSETGFVTKTSKPDREATLYERSSESLVLEQAHDILETVDTEELVVRINELHEKIEAYRDEFDAESPEDAVLGDDPVDSATLRDWQTTSRNLNIAKAALALSHAQDAVRTTQTV